MAAGDPGRVGGLTWICGSEGAVQFFSRTQLPISSPISTYYREGSTLCSIRQAAKAGQTFWCCDASGIIAPRKDRFLGSLEQVATGLQIVFVSTTSTGTELAELIRAPTSTRWLSTMVLRSHSPARGLDGGGADSHDFVPRTKIIQKQKLL